MGTSRNGPRPENNITVSRSSTPKTVNPETGKSVVAGSEPVTPEVVQPQRSFAQPSPVVEPKVLTPKAHASEIDEKEALKKNSALRTDGDDV